MDGSAADGGGDAQLQQGAQLRAVDAEVPRGKVKADLFPVAAEVDQRGQKADGLGDDGGQGGAEGLPPEHNHKEKVQQQVQDRGQGDEHEGVLGVAHAAQNGADDVIAVDKDQAAHAGDGVGHGLIPGFGGGIQPAHDLAAQQQADDADPHGAEHQEGGHGADEPGKAVPPPGTDVLGDDGLTGGGEAHGHKGQKGEHVAADGQAGQACLTHHAAHHHHVHHIINSLQ